MNQETFTLPDTDKLTKKFYYIRDKVTTENKCPHPRVTVCLLKIGDVVCRGLAICSLKDNPSKSVGRTIAMINALWANKKKTFGRQIKRKEAMEALKAVGGVPVNVKAAYNVRQPINQLEEKLLKLL